MKIVSRVLICMLFGFANNLYADTLATPYDNGGAINAKPIDGTAPDAQFSQLDNAKKLLNKKAIGNNKKIKNGVKSNTTQEIVATTPMPPKPTKAELKKMTQEQERLRVEQEKIRKSSAVYMVDGVEYDLDALESGKLVPKAKVVAQPKQSQKDLAKPISTKSSRFEDLKSADVDESEELF